MKPKIRVLIVDDSASVRQTMTKILSADPEIEVIGTASDPFAAARRMQDEAPDVITLDVEMPRMDGITFLRKLMAQHPLPVVMCSSLTEDGSATLMQALEAGAVDVILKPKLDVPHFLEEASIRICDAVKGAARARLKRVGGGRSEGHGGHHVPQQKLSADVIMPPPVAGQAMARTTETIDLRGCLHRRHGIVAGGTGGVAGGLPGDRDRAAHAGEIHRGVCAAARQPLRDGGEGGGGRRHGAARAGADRAR